MMYYTHCQNCGRKLTSTASQIRGYGWECWRKIIDNTPGLFDDDVSKTQENQIKRQGPAGTCRSRLQTRRSLLCSMWQVGRRRAQISPRTTEVTRRAGYYRTRRATVRIVPFFTSQRTEQQ